MSLGRGLGTLLKVWLLLTVGSPLAMADLNQPTSEAPDVHFIRATPATLAQQLGIGNKPSRLLLGDGVYDCGLVLDFPVALVAASRLGVVFDCKGQGSGIIINSPDVTLDGLIIRNSGNSFLSRDAAVAVEPGAHRVHLVNLDIDVPGFGVYSEAANSLIVQHSRFRGDKAQHLLDRGDGIHLKGGQQATLSHNHFSDVRDGIYLENTQDSKVFANGFSKLQYGVHTMYSRNEWISANDASQVLGGYALMSSAALTLLDNRVSGAREFGVLLNVTSDTLVSGNSAIGSVSAQDAEKIDIFTAAKGLFIYDATNNRIEYNHFIEGDIGVAIAMGAEANRFYGNVIAQNREELRYSGTVAMDWSLAGRGNFWGGYRGWDLNGDGIGDAPYRPNDRFDRLFLIYPEARSLMESPLVMLLKSLSEALALERGEGVTDPFPLISMPDLPTPFAQGPREFDYVN